MENKQTEAKFNPTAEQVAFANAYILNKGNISKACQSIGDKQRNKYYGSTGWRYQEGFENWLSEYAKKEVMKREGKWYLIAEKYAETGSYQHLRLLMELAHKFDDVPRNTIMNIIYGHRSAQENAGQSNANGMPNNPPRSK